jgi:hypothetical protein
LSQHSARAKADFITAQLEVEGASMKRRFAISQETNQVIVVRRHSKPSAWCANCKEQAQMVSVEDAILITGKNLRELIQVIDRGSLHYQETPEGLPLICLNSLDRLETGPNRRLLPKENE